MSEPASGYRYPYPTDPGASTAGPSMTPKEGVKDLWGFFWLSLASTAIIAVPCIGVWFFVH